MLTLPCSSIKTDKQCRTDGLPTANTRASFEVMLCDNKTIKIITAKRIEKYR